MKAAISVSSRGTRSRSSACSTSGKLVVAPSSTALTVPIIAFALTVAKVASPASDTVSGPSSTVVAAAATNGHEDGDEQHERQHDPAARPDRPRAARARAAASARARAGAADVDRPGVQRRRHRDDGDAGEARPASRAGRAGGPGCPGRRRRRSRAAVCAAALMPRAVRARASARERSEPVAEAEHQQRAGEPGQAGRDALVLDARERVVGHRRVLLDRRAAGRRR